jgi:predicted HTH transcriptional regulator
LKTKQANPELEHAVLKNIAAFLNTNGGTIFVGVDDTGEVVGIELDGFPNNDKWSLHLVNRIAQQLGTRFVPYCQIEFDKLARHSVCRITVQRGPSPAFFDETRLKKGGEKQAFYIRGGPSARKLDAAEAENYMVRRFSNPLGAKSASCVPYCRT